MAASQSSNPSEVSGYSDILALAIANLLGDLPSDMLSQIVDSVELQRINVGGRLYKQGDAGDSMHILLSGRLQVQVAFDDGSTTILAYPKPGDAVGEMAIFSGEPRAATIVAVRDSTLGVIRREAIDAIAAGYPQVLFNLSKVIISRLRGSRAKVARRSGARIIVIFSLHPSIDATAFTASLRLSLLRYGSVLLLDSAAARARQSTYAVDEFGRVLDDLESTHDFLILLADNELTPWTKICRGYADRILLLADSKHSHELTVIERWIYSNKDGEHGFARLELVLLHPAGKSPSATRKWLAIRPQVRQHYHLANSRKHDIDRLARLTSGNAVSLVLAGGGARGFAHLGVIRAMHEAGVSIDAIGGTSFGALAATGLARGMGDLEAQEELRLAFSRRDPLGDYTIPVMSLVRGEYLNRILRDHLPMDIEDLWLPYFAVSSDLSSNSVRIHDSGPLWKAIRASVSLPAILPPVLLDGHVLIDGGVMNNLPVDVMRERVDGPVIAVDLAVEHQSGGDAIQIPSAFDYIKSRLLPGRKSVDAPTVSRVILQVTTLASRKEVQSAKKQADLYLNPPVGGYDLLDWDRMREIANSGYEYSRPKIDDWLGANPARVERDQFCISWLARLQQPRDAP